MRSAYTRLATEIQRVEFDSTFAITATYGVRSTDDRAPHAEHDDTDYRSSATGSDVLADGVSCANPASRWRVALVGMSGQDSYPGGVMHASEQISAAIAQRLADDYDPGTVFALVVVNVDECEPDCVEHGPYCEVGRCQCDASCKRDGNHEPAGWTILARVG